MRPSLLPPVEQGLWLSAPPWLADSEPAPPVAAQPLPPSAAALLLALSLLLLPHPLLPANHGLLALDSTGSVETMLARLLYLSMFKLLSRVMAVPLVEEYVPYLATTQS